MTRAEWEPYPAVRDEIAGVLGSDGDMTDADRTAFVARTQILVKQYDAYEPLKGQRINAVRVMVGGVQMSIKEASEKLGLKRKVIEYRRQKGLPLVSGDLRKCQPSQA